MFLKKYIQYQKPQISMLKALTLPLLAGIYNFGWIAAVSVLFSMFCCWAAEYAFTRKENKPASAAALVTGMIFGLILPPNMPFWQIAVGSVFGIVFGKMVFGGFGKNIFNPAMVGRTFLYICFPATMAASWFVPFHDGVGGFAKFKAEQKTKSVDVSFFDIDCITSATPLAASKKLNKYALQAVAKKEKDKVEKANQALAGIPLKKLLIGNTSGSIGETSAILILISLFWLIYSKVVFVPLVIGPVLGIIAGNTFLYVTGLSILPFFHSLAVSMLAGGTFFAFAFMTTEPITAPMNKKARWAYGILIGFTAVMIRALSAFNEGLMFAVLLGNTFGPLIEIGFTNWDKRQKERAA